MSNFTDFDVLEIDPRFNLFYSDQPKEIASADIIILPGTKNTLADLHEIQKAGIGQAIVEAYKNGKKVIGICGGYQMMGARVEDPAHVEGDIEAIPGLGLLPQVTTIEGEKTTRQDQFQFLHTASETDATCHGYEIHMGTTRLLPGATSSPVARLSDGQEDGYYLDDHCWGSYLHGILDNPAVINHLAKGLEKETDTASFDYAAFKEAQYDKLADLVRANLDIPYIYGQLQQP